MQLIPGVQRKSPSPRPNLHPKGPRLSRREKRRTSTLLGREQEIALQASQVVDALLLVASLWIAHVFRWYLGDRFPAIPSIDPFGAFAWLIVIIVPFGLVLAFQEGIKWRSLRHLEHESSPVQSEEKPS